MLTTTDYAEPTCSCEKCVAMCTRFPCRPLPAEVAAMPRARLMLNTFWSRKGDVEYLQAASPGNEGEGMPEGAYGILGGMATPQRCTFLTPDGLCELHNKCKPWEGRTASCDRTTYPDGHEVTAAYDFPDRAVELLFEAWNTPEARAIVAAWKAEVNYDED